MAKPIAMHVSYYTFRQISLRSPAKQREITKLKVFTNDGLFHILSYLKPRSCEFILDGSPYCTIERFGRELE